MSPLFVFMYAICYIIRYCYICVMFVHFFVRLALGSSWRMA